jgi:hypothetical protein
MFTLLHAKVECLDRHTTMPLLLQGSHRWDAANTGMFTNVFAIQTERNWPIIWHYRGTGGGGGN